MRTLHPGTRCVLVIGLPRELGVRRELPARFPYAIAGPTGETRGLDRSSARSTASHRANWPPVLADHRFVARRSCSIASNVVSTSFVRAVQLGSAATDIVASIPEVNAEYVARMKDVLDLYAEEPDPLRPFVCFDETPGN